VVRISAHAGYAQAPRHATTRGELTRRAELALRAAAKKGAAAIVGFEHAIRNPPACPVESSRARLAVEPGRDLRIPSQDRHARSAGA
jgi:predicted signal transduction protein with EAL and GGDEF domain